MGYCGTKLIYAATRATEGWTSGSVLGAVLLLVLVVLGAIALIRVTLRR